MPTSYQFDAQGRFVLAVYQGVITLAEMREMFATYQADPRFCLDLPHLVDLSQATGTDVDYDGMRLLLRSYETAYKGSGSTMVVAIIAAGDLSFGMARMFENMVALTGIAKVGILETQAEAEEWISRLERSFHLSV